MNRDEELKEPFPYAEPPLPPPLPLRASEESVLSWAPTEGEEGENDK